MWYAELVSIGVQNVIMICTCVSALYNRWRVGGLAGELKTSKCGLSSAVYTGMLGGSRAFAKWFFQWSTLFWYNIILSVQYAGADFDSRTQKQTAHTHHSGIVIEMLISSVSEMV